MTQIDVASVGFPRTKGALVGGEIVVEDSGVMALGHVSLSKEQRARLGSVVRLLETASQTLPHRDNEAYRCVAKAAALLQAECDLGASDAATRHDSLPAWKTKRVLGFIDENLDRPIRIEEMASLANLSCSHFSRAFRATLGEPPSSFVVRRRVDRAEQLILFTDKPLSQIALDCGMADQSHLTKLFRRVYGMSPGKWRKLQHGSDGNGDQQAVGITGLPRPRVGGLATDTHRRDAAA
jgi:AraC family transcriptional regulator